MSGSVFTARACPACDARDPQDEVSSDRRADFMTPIELRPFWAGFHRDKVFFTYARCRNCKLLYAPRFFSLTQLAELYADLAPNMEDVPGPALEATQAGYWRAAIRRGFPKGGYLEVGPDIGYIVRDASREGDFDHFWLFEPNLAVHGVLAEAAGSRPHTISAEMDDLSPVPDDSVALAVMIHVLDHLLDPLKILRQVQAKLAPGGVLMIVTHNERSLLRRLMGTKFPPFCLQHPELYNPQSMTMLLERSGYGNIEIGRTTNYFPIDFLVRQAALSAGFNLSKVQLPRQAVGLKLGNMISFGSK